MRRNEKGFTLMELMVVIVIVAILAAVAVPLYINYVKDAKRTEAKGAIGAIITAEQAYYQNHNGVSYAPDLEALETANLVDISEAKLTWTFTTTGDANGFTATATPIAGKAADGVGAVTYTFTRAAGGTWTP